MSLKWSDPSGIQIGPSVNVKPVAICSTSADASTSSWTCSECAVTGMCPLLLVGRVKELRGEL